MKFTLTQFQNMFIINSKNNSLLLDLADPTPDVCTGSQCVSLSHVKELLSQMARKGNNANLEISTAMLDDLIILLSQTKMYLKEKSKQLSKASIRVPNSRNKEISFEKLYALFDVKDSNLSPRLISLMSLVAKDHMDEWRIVDDSEKKLIKWLQSVISMKIANDAMPYSCGIQAKFEMHERSIIDFEVMLSTAMDKCDEGMKRLQSAKNISFDALFDVGHFYITNRSAFSPDGKFFAKQENNTLKILNLEMKIWVVAEKSKIDLIIFLSSGNLLSFTYRDRQPEHLSYFQIWNKKAECLDTWHVDIYFEKWLISPLHSVIAIEDNHKYRVLILDFNLKTIKTIPNCHSYAAKTFLPDGRFVWSDSRNIFVYDFQTNQSVELIHNDDRRQNVIRVMLPYREHHLITNNGSTFSLFNLKNKQCVDTSEDVFDPDGTLQIIFSSNLRFMNVFKHSPHLITCFADFFILWEITADFTFKKLTTHHWDAKERDHVSGYIMDDGRFILSKGSDTVGHNDNTNFVFQFAAVQKYMQLGSSASASCSGLSRYSVISSAQATAKRPEQLQNLPTSRLG